MLKLKIYQIYYDAISKEHLDADFIPYDNTKGYSKWFEYGVIRENYLNDNYKSAEYTGFLSWKFKAKTRLNNCSDFISFIRENSGSDVYFLNPFPMLTNRFRNVWDCGESYHPGLKEIVTYIFQKLNYNIDLDQIVNNRDDTLYCNYWVGNEKFWKLFLKFSEPVYSYIESTNDPYLTEKILRVADSSSNASFIPYLMERFFSTFLFLNRENIKSKAMHLRTRDTLTLSLSPIYLKLEGIKNRELKGEDVHETRTRLLKSLDQYTEKVHSERFNNILQKFLSRIQYLYREIFRN